MPPLCFPVAVREEFLFVNPISVNAEEFSFIIFDAHHCQTVRELDWILALLISFSADLSISFACFLAFLGDLSDCLVSKSYQILFCPSFRNSECGLNKCLA